MLAKIDILKILKKGNYGQATVEAAIMIPTIFLLMLLLIQPGILLYDLCVMNAATSETCRVLATSSDQDKQKVCEPFIRRRLSSIPQQDNFHLHSSGCSYEFNFDGNQNSQDVCVEVKNQVKPLPLIGFLSAIVGLLNENDCFEISAKSQQKVKPDWIGTSPQGINPEYWTGGWLK